MGNDLLTEKRHLFDKSIDQMHLLSGNQTVIFQTHFVKRPEKEDKGGKTLKRVPFSLKKTSKSQQNHSNSL